MERSLSSIERAANSLREYYKGKGITEECDIERKYHAISEIVQIPNFPEGETPCLSDLERQFLIEHSSL